MNARLRKKLAALLEMDADEVRGFDVCLSRVEDLGLHEALEQLRQDHRRHVAELNEVADRYGARPARRSSVKDGLIDRILNLRGALGTSESLKALEDREQRIQQRYTDLLGEGELPVDVAGVVRRCRDDERRHLAAIRDVLAARARIAPGAH